MTTPTRRIRNARLRYARSHAAARAQRLTARLRSKDIVISAIAQSAADAEAAADALRMERDAAHEECARLSVSGVVFRNIARVFEGLYTSAEADLASADTIAARLVEVICDQDERLKVLLGVADEADALGAECYRLQEDIDTLTAERDHARAIAVALEQDVALVRRHSVNVSDVATFLEDAWDDGNATGLDGWEGPGRGVGTPDRYAINARRLCVDGTLLRLSDALHAQALARVPMDSDRTPEVER